MGNKYHDEQIYNIYGARFYIEIVYCNNAGIRNMLALQFLVMVLSTILSSAFSILPPSGLDSSENVYVPSRNVDHVQHDLNLEKSFPDDSNDANFASDINILSNAETQPQLYAEDRNDDKLNFPQETTSGEPGCDSSASTKAEIETIASGNMCPPTSNNQPPNNPGTSRSARKRKPNQTTQNQTPGAPDFEWSSIIWPVDCSKIPGNPRRLYCCEKGPPSNRGAPLKLAIQDASRLSRRNKCRACKRHDRVGILINIVSGL